MSQMWDEFIELKASGLTALCCSHYVVSACMNEQGTSGGTAESIAFQLN